MKIEYQGKKWNKEVTNFQKFKKSVKGNLNKNELYDIDEFVKTGSTDYLHLYNHLAGTYECMTRYCYLDDINSQEVKKYVYLSGIAMRLSIALYEKGMRTKYIEIIENSIERDRDYALFKLIAVEEMDSPYIGMDENTLTILMYNQNYEQARVILEQLPDNPDESIEVYYVRNVFLKKIYMAIMEHDEKKFNEELAKRIKKYRRNMVGYSTIVDIVSIALIKMAEREGLHCTVDVIEIPKQFFDKSCKINKNEVKLPFYDEFLEQAII